MNTSTTAQFGCQSSLVAASDAPAWYGHAEAHAWADGYNAAIESFRVAQNPTVLDEGDPKFCAMVNAARDEHFRLKGFHPYSADIIAMLKAALSVSSTDREGGK
jgi:hypothetical protein